MSGDISLFFNDISEMPRVRRVLDVIAPVNEYNHRDFPAPDPLDMTAFLEVGSPRNWKYLRANQLQIEYSAGNNPWGTMIAQAFAVAFPNTRYYSNSVGDMSWDELMADPFDHYIRYAGDAQEKSYWEGVKRRVAESQAVLLKTIQEID